MADQQDRQGVLPPIPARPGDEVAQISTAQLGLQETGGEGAGFRV